MAKNRRSTKQPFSTRNSGRGGGPHAAHTVMGHAARLERALDAKEHAAAHTGPVNHIASSPPKERPNTFQWRGRTIQENNAPISPEGKLTTSRYQTWTVEMVADIGGEQGRGFLPWCVNHAQQHGTITPEMVERVQKALAAQGNARRE